MPSFTKKAIKESFLKLLSQRPLNQITIKDIVEDCGISRNSFYYHFEDLPALIEEILREQVQSLVDNHPTIDSIEQGFDAAIELVMQNKRAIYHIYNSVSRDIFERYLLEGCSYLVATYIDAALNGLPIPESDKKVLIRFHKCTCFGSIIDWLSSGMKEDIYDYVHRVCEWQKLWLEDIIHKCSNNP